jgi:hypothetical protein
VRSIRTSSKTRYQNRSNGGQYNDKFYDQDKDKYFGWVDKLKDGTHVFVTVEKITREKQRSLDQNAYYWGVVVKILAGETGYTKDEMHEALKVKFLTYENVKGIPTVLSTANLNTKQFEVYLEMVRRWAAMDLGIVIPEPNQVDFTD